MVKHGKHQSKSSVKLSIIIPVFNERETLSQILERIQKLPYRTEIIIVDDGSIDGTRDLFNKIKEPNIKILMHENNRGKGAAVRTAQPHVTGDFVIIQDADLEYQPEEYPELLAPLLSGQADVVYGSRFIGPHRAYYFWNFLANKFLNLLSNLLYNTILSDMECGYKVFRADIFKNIKIRSNRFDLEPELTAKVFKQNLKVVEVPITYFGRSYAEGKKITWKDFFPAMWTLIKYRFVD
ncbi:MAG: glycosyltransferase family 2 protein [bacterium]|nr:MAG: glycosyltransferase family 2 protein [bacterium]